MSRKGNIKTRVINCDPKYHDKVVAKLINKIMICGKKSLAERICYGAFDLIEDRKKEEPLKLFKKALDKVKPMLEVKSRRVGGSTYQVPVEIRSERRTALAMNWIINSASARGEKSFVEQLAGELIDASNGKGGAIKKREDVHKMAEANKAFAHYRW